MNSGAVHGKLLWVLLTLTLTCAAPAAFAETLKLPSGYTDAVADLENVTPERRAAAIVWLATHAGESAQPLMVKRLRDENEVVRAVAEQGLWRLWSRSGDAAIDKVLAAGTEHLQEARFKEAIAAFSDVILLKPAFAEGWNKRATAHYLAGDFQRSLADCDEVLKRNPQHFGALSGYGQIHFQLGEYDKALHYWRRALEVNPNMPGVEANIQGLEILLKEKKGRTI